MQINEVRNDWISLFWNISDGNPQSFDTVKKMNVFEFWAFFEKWEQKIKQQIENNKNN